VGGWACVLPGGMAALMRVAVVCAGLVAASATRVPVAVCSQWYDASEWVGAGRSGTKIKSNGFKIEGGATLYSEDSTTPTSSYLSLSATVQHRKDENSAYMGVSGTFPVVAYNRHCHDEENASPYKREVVGFDLYDVTGGETANSYYETELRAECASGGYDVKDHYGSGYHSCPNGEASGGTANATRAWLPNSGMRSLQIQFPEHLFGPNNPANIGGPAYQKGSIVACCDLYPKVADQDCEDQFVDEYAALAKEEEEIMDRNEVINQAWIESRTNLEHCQERLAARDDCISNEKLELAGGIIALVFLIVGIGMGVAINYMCTRRAKEQASYNPQL